MNTPLELDDKMIRAAARGNISGVQKYLAQGAQINSFSNSFKRRGLTALICAVDKNELEMVDFLLRQGADINLGRSTVPVLSSLDKPEILQLLLSKKPSPQRFIPRHFNDDFVQKHLNTLMLHGAGHADISILSHFLSNDKMRHQLLQYSHSTKNILTCMAQTQRGQRLQPLMLEIMQMLPPHQMIEVYEKMHEKGSQVRPLSYQTEQLRPLYEKAILDREVENCAAVGKRFKI